MERLVDPGLTAAAERAMRRWELRRRVERQAAEQATQPRFCITISREAGARGSTIARLVGQRLSWPVYDLELLEYIAHEMHLRASVLESLDEKAYNWTNEWLANLLGAHWANQDSYIVHLTRVILAIGMHGDAIIVGRGAACILPRERSLNVRVIARDADRVAFLSQVVRLTPQEAEKYMRETDAQRRKFVKDYFHRDVGDPHEYDLTIDSSRLGEEAGAELVAVALRGKQAFTLQQQATQTRVSHVPTE